MKTAELAEGRWDGIITALIGEHAVQRKHGPCPMCGGKDRYRYDNKFNTGNWFCNGCGSGDGFALLQGTLDINFAEAAKLVDGVVGVCQIQPFKENFDAGYRRGKLNEMWQTANAPKVMKKYLLHRGIPESIIDQAYGLRGHNGIRLYDADRKSAGIFPAMLALIRNRSGTPVSIHRTYLIRGETKKKMMPPTEKITGGCIRLGSAEDTLILAEGIETALGAWALIGHPAWALMSANNVEAFCGVPPNVKKLIICADNDASYAGQKAAFALAYRYKNSTADGKKTVVVVMPKERGHDMLDAWTNTQKGKSGILTWSA